MDTASIRTDYPVALKTVNIRKKFIHIVEIHDGTSKNRQGFNMDIL